MAYIRDELLEEECTKCAGHGFRYVKDDEIECSKCGGVGMFLFYESVDDYYGETEKQYYPIKIEKRVDASFHENLQDCPTEVS
jgi:RecJ-like exonuclease